MLQFGKSIYPLLISKHYYLFGNNKMIFRNIFEKRNNALKKPLHYLMGIDYKGVLKLLKWRP